MVSAVILGFHLLLSRRCQPAFKRCFGAAGTSCSGRPEAVAPRSADKLGRYYYKNPAPALTLLSRKAAQHLSCPGVSRYLVVGGAVGLGKPGVDITGFKAVLAVAKLAVGFDAALFGEDVVEFRWAQ